MKINDYKYYYFLGIGGIGMSALARYFNYLKKSVLGYDKTKTEITDCLISEGMEIHFDSNLDLISKLPKDKTLVIYTPAIPKKQEELMFFQESGYDLIKRSEALARISNTSTSIAVAGTHGKTTTTGILGHILNCSDLKVTTFTGGILENYNSNFITSGNDITVVEADEFDRSFLRLKPNFGVITSIDPDHLDIYDSKADFEDTFQQFSDKIIDFKLVKKGLPIVDAHTYAVEQKADYYANNIKIEEGRFIFDFFSKDTTLYNLSFRLPGKHNIENATAAIAIAIQMGLEKATIRKGIESFTGINRRFTTYKTKSGKIIINDYAHHPSEINVTLDAACSLYPNKRILGVFQPHLYSRTKDFANEFVESLNQFENLILIDIYPAREEPMKGITSQWLADKLNKKPISVAQLSEVQNIIIKQDFDVLLLLGAGDINTIVKPITTFYEED